MNRINGLTRQHAYVTPEKALSLCVSALNGVPHAALPHLHALKIAKIVDFSVSSIFRTGNIPDNIDSTQTESFKKSVNSLLKVLGLEYVSSLRDWAPYCAAISIFQAAVAKPIEPNEAPIDLIPANGAFATERQFYKTFLIDDEPADLPDQEEESDDNSQKQPQNAASEKKSKSQQKKSPQKGSNEIYFGSILTMEQCWYNKGVALGSLVHSLPLAPGESTKLAIVDWSVLASAKTEEAGTQADAISSELNRDRSFSEVTNSVATESQRGFSTVNSVGSTVQEGSSGGLGAAIFGGSSSASAVSASSVNSVAGNDGVRTLGASLTQKVVDTTHQSANSVRSRRSSVIAESLTGGKTSVSTRTVTNYNHMHALTMQYYEVVQVYNVLTKISCVERCLFVKMGTFDFLGLELNLKQRQALAKISDDATFKTLLDTVQRPTSVLSTKLKIELPDGELRAQLADSIIQFKDKEAIIPQHARLRFRPVGDQKVKYKLLDGIDTDEDAPVYKIKSIVAKAGKAGTDFKKGDILAFELQINSKTVVIHLVFESDESNSFDIVSMLRNPVTEEYIKLIKALLADEKRYAEALLRSEDTDTLIQLLGERLHSFRDYFDPQPIAVASGYLVFRARNVMERKFSSTNPAEWIKRHSIDFNEVREQEIALPSDGIFVEAVLGRFNSAEKLDITRFWNWKDSPLPVEAPSIAAVEAKPGQPVAAPPPTGFAAPIVNIMNPPAIPDPQGMKAAIDAVSKPDLFRDMSGLAAASAISQALISQTGQSASNAAQAALENQKLSGEMLMKVAALAAAAYTGNPALAAAALGGDSSTSSLGAMFNHAKSLDSASSQTDEGAEDAAGGDGGQDTAIEANGSKSATPVPKMQSDMFRRAIGLPTDDQTKLLSSILGDKTNVDRNSRQQGYYVVEGSGQIGKEVLLKTPFPNQDIGFESDLLEASTVVRSDGNGVVRVGPLKRVGIYGIRIRKPSDQSVIIFALDGIDDRLSLISKEAPATDTAKLDSQLASMERFWNVLKNNKDIYKMALQQNAVEFFSNNTVKLSEIGTHGLLCASVKYGCFSLAAESLTLGAQFLVDSLKTTAKLLAKAHKLSAADAANVCDMIELALGVADLEDLFSKRGVSKEKVVKVLKSIQAVITIVEIVQTIAVKQENRSKNVEVFLKVVKQGAQKAENLMQYQITVH